MSKSIPWLPPKEIWCLFETSGAVVEASVLCSYEHWGSNPGLFKFGENRKEGGCKACRLISLNLVVVTMPWDRRVRPLKKTPSSSVTDSRAVHAKDTCDRSFLARKKPSYRAEVIGDSRLSPIDLSQK